MEDRYRNSAPFHEDLVIDGKSYINIKIVDLIKFWESLGYRKVILEDYNYKIVKLTRNSIVTEVKEHVLRDEVKAYLEYTNRIDVLNEFLSRDYVIKRLFESLKVIEINLNTGDKETGFLYYRNIALKVTKDKIEPINYENLDSYIWERQIIQRDIKPSAFEDSDFKRFMVLICNNDIERLFSLITIIGYLLHSYKDSTNTKAVILIDSEIDIDDDSANGGTGKTLIGRAIGLLIPSLFIDGKSVKNQDKFRFSGLQPYHKIIIYDDVKKDFDFESLYPLITGEFQIEKKYKNAETISFGNSPKILISSNYVVKGTGGNAEKRRKIEFEVSDYFKNTKTPLEEFKHRLFDDWDKEQWLMFDNLMIKSLQVYLTHGLHEPNSINLTLNRIKTETNSAFIDFMHEVIDNPIAYNGKNEENSLIFDKIYLMNVFLNLNPEMKGKITHITFKKWIDKFGKYNNLEINHYKSNGKVFVKFIL